MNKRVIYLLLSICGLIPFALDAQTAKWVIKPQYTSVTAYGDGMYKVKLGRSVGVLDMEGKAIVPVFADSITPLIEECALVLQYEEGKSRLKGILHGNRKMVSVTEEWFVDDFAFFSEGKLPVYIKNGKYGYIGPNGKLILDFDYGFVHPFSEGWAAVSKGKSILGKGIGLIKKNIAKSNKEKVFYIDEQGRMMTLQSDIGDIYTGTSFKNGEALVITKDNRYCIINTSGQLLRIDNNVILMFDEKYALAVSNEVKENIVPVMAYDGPTTFVENSLYGYKQGNKVILPAQFQTASPFSKGYAIVAKENKYGVLKLLKGDFQCRSTSGTLKTADAGMESVDYVISVPDDWKDGSLELTCINGDKTKTCSTQPGNASNTRIFSFILPKGKPLLSLDGENLVVWESGMAATEPENNLVKEDELSILISPASVKANVKDNAPIAVTLTNNTSEAIELTVKITGDRLKSVTKKLSLAGGQTEKLSTYFTKVSEEESRTVSVSTSLTENKVSKRIRLLPFFVKY